MRFPRLLGRYHCSVELLLRLKRMKWTCHERLTVGLGVVGNRPGTTCHSVPPAPVPDLARDQLHSGPTRAHPQLMECTTWDADPVLSLDVLVQRRFLSRAPQPVTSKSPINTLPTAVSQSRNRADPERRWGKNAVRRKGGDAPLRVMPSPRFAQAPPLHSHHYPVKPAFLELSI